MSIFDRPASMYKIPAVKHVTRVDKVEREKAYLKRLMEANKMIKEYEKEQQKNVDK